VAEEEAGRVEAAHRAAGGPDRVTPRL